MLARLGGFILLPIYLQLMSREEYGLVALVTSIVGVLTILCRVGLDGALMRLHFDVAAPRQAPLYRTLMLLTTAISGGVLLILALGVGPFFDRIFFGVPFFPYGALALGITFVGITDYVPAILYRASQQPGRFFAFSFGSFVVASLLSLGLVLAGLNAIGVLLGQLIGGAIVMGVVIIVTFRPGGDRWDGSVVRPALRFGAPLVPHQISTWTLRLSDRWLLGLLLAVPTAQRLAAIGAYSVGYQVGSLVAIMGQSFNAAWTPYFYRIADEAEGPTIYRHILTLTVSGFAWIALGLAVTSGEVIDIIARPGYEVAAQVIPVVAFASVAQALYIMLVGPIFLRRQTAVLPILTVASAATNVLMNVLLIPRIGVMGAAWATLAAYLLFAVLTFILAQRIYPVRVDVRRLLAIVVVCVSAALVAAVPHLESWPALGRLAAHLVPVFIGGAVILQLLRGPIRQLRRSVARASDEAAEM